MSFIEFLHLIFRPKVPINSTDKTPNGEAQKTQYVLESVFPNRDIQEKVMNEILKK